MRSGSYRPTNTHVMYVRAKASEKLSRLSPQSSSAPKFNLLFSFCAPRYLTNFRYISTTRNDVACYVMDRGKPLASEIRVSLSLSIIHDDIGNRRSVRVAQHFVEIFTESIAERYQEDLSFTITFYFFLT